MGLTEPHVNARSVGLLCAAGCGRRVRLDGLRCSTCFREAGATPPAAASDPRLARVTFWRCSCGGSGVERHQLHALFALYAHRRRCELLARSAVAA